jgi:hypothetical protein
MKLYLYNKNTNELLQTYPMYSEQTVVSYTANQIVYDEYDPNTEETNRYYATGFAETTEFAVGDDNGIFETATMAQRYVAQ